MTTMLDRPAKTLREPEKRNRLLWFAVGWVLSLTFVFLGAGYAVGGENTNATMSLHLLTNLEGTVRVHGIILITLSWLLCYSLGSYSKLTWLALVGTLFYSLITATLIFMGWVLYPIDWGAPWWYLLAGGLSAVLLAFAPPRSTPGFRRGGGK